MSPPATSWVHQHSSASVQVLGGTSFDVALAGNGFDVSFSFKVGFEVDFSFVNLTSGIMRYWPDPNTLGGMEGCPRHLTFNACVPHSKMMIILFMQSLVLGGGTPIAPGSILQNNTSHATDRQSLCLLSLNAQMNSSKALV